MKTLIEDKRTLESEPAIHDGLDAHKWATKVEIHHLLSGKPDLKIEADSRTR